MDVYAIEIAKDSLSEDVSRFDPVNMRPTDCESIFFLIIVYHSANCYQKRKKPLGMIAKTRKKSSLIQFLPVTEGAYAYSIYVTMLLKIEFFFIQVFWKQTFHFSVAETNHQKVPALCPTLHSYFSFPLSVLTLFCVSWDLSFSRSPPNIAHMKVLHSDEFTSASVYTTIHQCFITFYRGTLLALSMASPTRPRHVRANN